MKSIKEVFAYHGANVKINNELISRLRSFESNFVNANEDHVYFFGGNLLATYQIKFTQSDFNLWWDSVTEIDDLSLQQDLYTLDSVNPQHKVATNAFNLSCIWLMHRIKVSNLPKSTRREGMVLCGLILLYRMFSSVLLRNFPYGTDKTTAEAMYAKLSRKFELKREGSWKKYLVARANDMTDDRSLHHSTLTHFLPDDAVLYMVSDVQTRVRQSVKVLTDAFYEARAAETRNMSVSSKVMNPDGEEVLRDIINNDAAYLNYVKDSLLRKEDFIRENILQVTLDMTKQGSEKALREFLESLVSNYSGKYKKTINEFIEGIVIHAVNYIADNPKSIPNRNDLINVVTVLRGLHLSSKTSDEYVMKVRNSGNMLVNKLSAVRNNNAKSLLRNMTVLYIIILTFSKK